MVSASLRAAAGIVALVLRGDVALQSMSKTRLSRQRAVIVAYRIYYGQASEGIR